MITDKDWEDKNDAYDVALKILSLGNTESTPGNIADIINKHATESAEQARKEAEAWKKIVIEGIEELEFEINECTRCGKTAPMTEYDIYLNLTRGRAAILGDSVIKENLTTDHIPDISEKLAIAVNALEVIRDNALNPAHTMTKFGLEQVTDANRAISDRALKEIQG